MYVLQFFSPTKEKTYAYKVGDKTMKQKQRGRPNLCRGTKERKKIFDNRLQGYSLQALPDAPPLICLSELAEKTQLPFQMLRTLIVIEGKIPYIMVGKKYFVNYSHFIKYMDELD